MSVKTTHSHTHNPGPDDHSVSSECYSGHLPRPQAPGLANLPHPSVQQVVGAVNNLPPYSNSWHHPSPHPRPQERHQQWPRSATSRTGSTRATATPPPLSTRTMAPAPATITRTTPLPSTATPMSTLRTPVSPLFPTGVVGPEGKIAHLLLLMLTPCSLMSSDGTCARNHFSDGHDGPHYVPRFSIACS